MDLQPHHSQPPSVVESIRVGLDTSHVHWLQLRWRIEPAGSVILPRPAGRRRRDGLWQTTCFEMFVKPDDGTAYLEFNLSASEQWNAYRFDSYRTGMQEHPMPRAPVCTLRSGGGIAIFDVALPRAALPEKACAIGLSAVIEEGDGVKSYWALAHSPEGPPDFHAPACFAARLDAPKQP